MFKATNSTEYLLRSSRFLFYLLVLHKQPETVTGTIPQVTQTGKMVQNEVWCTEITALGVCKGLEHCCPFLKITALIVCAPSPPYCDRTGGDPDQSGTVLHLQPRPAQPAGRLWCSTQQITGGTWLMLPQHTGITPSLHDKSPSSWWLAIYWAHIPTLFLHTCFSLCIQFTVYSRSTSNL